MRKSLINPVHFSTRRKAIAGMAVALGGVVTHLKAQGQTNSSDNTILLSPVKNPGKTSLHQEVVLHASAQKIYKILLDSQQFAAFTGMPATIAPEAGGAFSMFGGMIEGRNIQLVPDQMIVQAWRPKHWEPGVYSIVRFTLQPEGSQTTVVLDHTGFPEGNFEHLDEGWRVRYWKPLELYLAKEK
jgi:activator of HSP90 ATPase